MGHALSYPRTDCSDAADVEARISSVSRAFGALRECLFSPILITSTVKKSVYEGFILPILWCLTEKLLNCLRTFHARCIRTMCRVTRLHHISNADLDYELVCCQWMPMLLVVSYAGWMKSDRLPHQMLTSWFREKRPRGAPDYTYGREVYKALKKVNIGRNEWYECAQDRNVWRNVINRAS
uniref:Uncharacterized protein n=1 Tax=Clytia hemisphaerica TaxID=252671 RepID=A0A7M5WWE1_9CNID